MKKEIQKTLWYLIPIVLLVDSFIYTIFTSMVSSKSDEQIVFGFGLLVATLYLNVQYFKFLLTKKINKDEK